MKKLAAAIWLFGILAAGKELDGLEVIQPAPVAQPSGLVVDSG